MMYLSSSTAYLVSTDATTYTGSIPTNANTGVATFALSDVDGSGMSSTVTITRSGLTTATISNQNDTSSGGTNLYTLAWSGNNLVVTEVTDNGTASEISGTVYWYK